MKIVLKKRKFIGKKVKQLRAKGMVPVVVYGPKRKSTNLRAEINTLEKLFDKIGYSNILDYEVEGEDMKGKALIREVQFDPVKDHIIHVAFLELDMTKPITTEVPLVTVGASRAVTEKIGFLVTPMETISIRCLPDKLPSQLEIDISSLDAVGDSVNIDDLKLSKGVEFDAEVTGNAAIAYIAPPQKEIVEEEPVVAEEAEEGEEGEKKEGEEGEVEKGAGEDSEEESEAE